MTLSTTLLLFALSLILLPFHSSANEGNILVTGDILPTEGQLSYGDVAFVIQGDCNLVLYNKHNGFQSNTHGRGTDCTLTLSDHGQLIIKTGAGKDVWSSSPVLGSKNGTYVAVLGPDGQVNIYGPSIWSTPKLLSSLDTIDIELNTIPFVRNVFFSSQILDRTSTLTSRDYSFGITDACNLEFTKASGNILWESDTKGKGQNCFARLDDYGLLSLVNDNRTVLWTSTSEGLKGDYVLVVQIQGQAVIYGPVVWSTSKY